MELTDDERRLILAGLFELRITHLEDDDRCAAIDALAAKLGVDLGRDVLRGTFLLTRG